MKLRDAIGFSFASLIKSPVKTLLTVLGLGVGIGAILTVLTLGDAGQHQVEHEIAKLGVSKLWLTPEKDTTLPTDAGSVVAAATGSPACAGAMTMSVVRWGDKAGAAQIGGYDECFDAVHAPVLVEGRLPTQREFATGAQVGLVDGSMAEFLGDALGKRVDIGSRKVRIIGVIAPMQGQAAAMSNGMIVVPLRTFMDTFAPQGVSEVTVDVSAGQNAQDAGIVAAAALGGPDAVKVTSLQEEIDAARSIIRIFVMVLACVAAVCMLTGGIGVMNILLVSVRERRREIGLMKAVGGTSTQVGLMFLLEALCYALLGGLLGVALGMVMIKAFGRMIGLTAALRASTALPTLLAAAALGVGFGVAPALRAARLMPVAALRQDE